MSAVKDLEVLKKCRETIKLALVTFTGNIIDYVTLRAGWFGIDGLDAGPYRMSEDSSYRRSFYDDAGDCLTFSKTEFGTNVTIKFSNAKPTDGMNGVLAEIKIMELRNYHDAKTYKCQLYHVPLVDQDEGAFHNLYYYRLFMQHQMIKHLEVTQHRKIEHVYLSPDQRFPNYN